MKIGESDPIRFGLEAARKKAAQLRGLVAAGKDPADDRRAEREAGAFAELAHDYL